MMINDCLMVITCVITSLTMLMTDVVVVIGRNIKKICACVTLLDLSACICVRQIVFILYPWLMWLVFVSIELREISLFAIDNNDMMACIRTRIQSLPFGL